MSTRESFFVCRFTSPRGRRTAHVRAWDEDQAAMVFASELQQDGCEPGTIEIVRAAGRGRRLEARYEPPRATAS